LDHLDGLDEVVLVADPSGRVLYANETARHLHPHLTDLLVEERRLDALFPDSTVASLGEVIRQALAGRGWTGRMPVIEADGTAADTDVSFSSLRHDGLVVAVLCVIDHSTTPRGHAREARRLGDRLSRLARVAAELGTAETIETITKVVTSVAADAVGATVASLSLLTDPDTLTLVALRGGREGAAERWATYSVHDRTPTGDAVRTGQMVVLTGKDAINERYPGLERAAPGERSMIALPLQVVGRPMGAISLSFPGRRGLDSVELEFLRVLADSCAQALQRLRAERDAEEQAARIRFLADATTELSASLDYQLTLANVARLAVPRFADWCAIDVVADDRLHRLAVEHVDPAKVELAAELERRYPADPASPAGSWAVLRSRTSLIVPEITDRMLVASAVDEEQLRLTRALGLSSALLVPLVARGKAFGVMTWVSAESDHRYSDTDARFAEDLAARAAIAIDNAQLHSQTRQAAEELQRAVLPDSHVRIPGWTVASCYNPSGRTEVGGDFFDVLALSDNRLAVFVGDVMGRGVEAAAAMAQMRAAVRAYIAIDPAPTAVLGNLDRFFSTYAVSQLVTLVYVLAEPDVDRITVINAGHPAPVLLRADGSLEQLPDADEAPLGLHPGARRPLTRPFHAHDAVLAFTDGLVERRHEDIDRGQQRLRDALQSLGRTEVAESLAALVETVRDPTRDDDVAAVLVRRLT
jgi:serine phosphatase RsbU (regulator of sigma subunit)